MQVSVADAGTLRKRISISYTAAEIAGRRDQVLRRFGDRAKLDGFRPGKSPKALLEKRYGTAATEQAREELADEGFRQALSQHRLMPLGPVKHEKTDAKDGLALEVSFEVPPAVVLPEAKDFTLPDEPVQVDAAKIDEIITGIARRAGSLQPLPAGSTLAEDDDLVLDGTVTVNGAEVRKLESFHHLLGGYPLLGKPAPEVLALFKPLAPGAQVDFTTTLPQAFQPAEAAGKEAQVSVTVTAANRIEPVAIDDALAQKVGAPTLGELKEMLRRRMQIEAEGAKRRKQVEALQEQLLAKVQVELPPQMAEAVRADAKEAAEARIKDEGKTGADADSVRAEVAQQAELTAKRFIVLSAIADQFNVTVDNQDLSDQIAMAAQRTGRRPQDIAKRLKESGQVGQVAHEIREAKALEVYLDRILGRENPAHGQAGHVHGPDCAH